MIHNQLTNYARLMAGFRRALGEMGADFTGIERAGETLTPIVDLWALPEWALLRGEVLYSTLGTALAQAGLFSSIELINPTGSGLLVVVLELNATAGTNAVAVDSGVALGAVATLRGIANDERHSLGPTSVCTVVTGNLAAGLAQEMDIVNVGTRASRPYILRPGQKLFISSIAVNTTIQNSILWSERPMQDTERAL